MVIATPRGGAAAGAAAPATAAPALELEMRRGGVGETNPPETFAAAPGQTLDDLMAEAVIGVQDSLDEQWKSANLLRYDQRARHGGGHTDCPAVGLGGDQSGARWPAPRSTDVEIATFARDKVRAQIRYIGDQFRLEEALGRVGLALSREGESWRLLPTGVRSQPRRAGERDVDIVLSRSPVNLANLVTVGRLLMVVTAGLADRHRTPAGGVLAVSCRGRLSDAVDGFIAKRFNAKTTSAPTSIRWPTRSCSMASTSPWPWVSGCRSGWSPW